MQSCSLVSSYWYRLAWSMTVAANSRHSLALSTQPSLSRCSPITSCSDLRTVECNCRFLELKSVRSDKPTTPQLPGRKQLFSWTFCACLRFWTLPKNKIDGNAIPAMSEVAHENIRSVDQNVLFECAVFILALSQCFAYV